MTYHYRPVREHEYDKIKRALDILKGVIARENGRHMMDEELHPGMKELLESEIIPLLENELSLDYDPSPYYLYDNTGGEAPITQDKQHSAALAQHIFYHS